MTSAWSVIRKHLGQGRDDLPSKRVGKAPEPSSKDDLAATGSSLALPANAGQSHLHHPALDAVGQKTELIRVRMSQMADRLDDVRSLTEEFANLAEPLNTMIVEFPQLQMRLLETETLLGQERQAATGLRREVDELATHNSNIFTENSTLLAQARRHETLLRERDSEVEELRLALHERASQTEGLERQLFTETDRSRTLAEDNQSLRGELHNTDQALVRAERELAETREQNGILSQDNKRLQESVREQAERIVALNAASADLAQQVAVLREAAGTFEGRLAAEQAARQKIETQRDAEGAAHRTELSALQVQVQTLTARIAATDRMLSHARAQLLEREDALKTAERALKEGVLERGKVERQVAAAQDEIDRLSAQVNEVNASRSELSQRCDMLVRTVVAKETAVESANGKAISLSDRLEQLTKRFEQERTALEAQNRRLIEELQNEKAERSLAQGALEIARESRNRLQKQYAALKQKSRFGRDEAVRDAAVRGHGDEDAGEGENAPSNVRRFPPTDADGEGQR